MATKPLRSLTFPGLSDTYTVAATDPTLKLTGEPADAKTVGDWLTTSDAKATVAEELATEGLTDYNYGTDYSDNITSTLAMTRHGMLVTLNGTVGRSSNGNPFMIKLNGAPAYGGTGGAIGNFEDPLMTLVTGHTYRFKIHRISGSFTGDLLYAGAVKYGTYPNLGTDTVSGDDYIVDFEPPAEGVQLGIKVTRKESAATLTNLVLLCTLEDLSVQTEEQKDIEELQETRAKIDGAYDDLTAGSAGQLLATTGAEDRAPYTLRQTGGGVAVGDRAVEKIVGGTIAWNQLNENNGSTATVKGVTYTKGDNGVWAITGTATGSDRKTISTVSVSQNHVFAIFPGASDSALYGTSGSNVAAGKIALVILHGSDSSSQSFIGFGGAIIKKSSYTMTSLRAAQSTTFVSGETGLTICPQLFDLTQMFGSTVADAVYAMEQATAGAGVAWFRAMFPESYYPYNAGELMSVQTSGKTSTSADNTVVKTYPLDSSLILRGIPKWDSVNGTMYYDGDEYTRDGSVTRWYRIVDLGALTWSTRGTGDVQKVLSTSLDAEYRTQYSGKLKWLCPQYEQQQPSSAIMLTRDIDTNTVGIYSYQSASGTSKVIYLVLPKEATPSGELVYEVATPTTESATPYTGTQCVEAGGTETFLPVDGASVVVPVGHKTFYPTDLRGGLETLLSPEVTVTGATATITAERDRRYLCGTMNALTFTPCASGLCEVRFTSGTTPTALTLPQTVKMPDWWTGVEANYTYEISIADGVYGAVMAWAT